MIMQMRMATDANSGKLQQLFSVSILSIWGWGKVCDRVYDLETRLCKCCVWAKYGLTKVFLSLVSFIKYNLED